jgi:integrase
MRQGELLSLTQKNVNLKKCVATLPRTKNGSSRDVPLSGYAVNILIAIGVKDDGRYFSLTSATCDALFRKIKKLAGVEDLHFHDSRREATTRLSKKVDVLTLARITGHKDLKMLLTYYETDMSDVAKLLS